MFVRRVAEEAVAVAVPAVLAVAVLEVGATARAVAALEVAEPAAALAVVEPEAAALAVVVPEEVEPEAVALAVVVPEEVEPEAVEPEAAALAVVVLAAVEPEAGVLVAAALEARGQDRAVEVLVPAAAHRAAVHQGVRAPRAAPPTLAAEYPILGVPLVLASRQDQAQPVLAQPTVTGLGRPEAAGIPERIMEAERSRKGLAPTRCARSISAAIATGLRPIA
jgi:hypothetical protein